jgi:MoaA/NifB/PqqE/SkfB family radical SAM enzyme
MSLKHTVFKTLAVQSISKCLTGRPEDLRRLFLLEKIPYPSPILRAFLRRLRRDLDEGSGVFGNLLLRIGQQANAVSRKKLIENLIFNLGVKGAHIRVRIRQQGLWTPFLVAVSPTMRCNLKCAGCYSGLYSKEGELSELDLDRVFSECKKIGNYFVVLTGGEPYLLKNVLFRLFKKHNDMFFLTFTNGTRFDEPLVKEMAQLGNVASAISIEGFEEETDSRRGTGVYKQILKTIELLNRERVMFGISVTYTSQNVDAVTQDCFIEFFMNRGALFAWYFMFMPVGKDPVLKLVPTPEQRIYCGRRVEEMRKKYPMFIADFWNDGPAVGGCMAGGRRYLHILNSGRVEACVFAHFGVDNIREKSLLEAANSPFFKAIRQAFPFNETGNLRRPCMILDNPQVLRRLVNEYVAHPGHDHSEDIVGDPIVTKWADEYSERLRALTEPEWLETIANPASRWHKEKQEYRNLFQFKSKKVDWRHV